VTGASSGIGKATTGHLASAGFNVFACARTKKDLDDLSKIENVISVKLDVTSNADTRNAVRTIEKTGSGLYGLVNNAGIGGIGPILDTPTEKISSALDVNLLGLHRITRALFPFIHASSGRIVMISSMNGFLALPFTGVYNTSKFALEGYTATLRRELIPYSIPVISIWPGRTDTPIFSKAKDEFDRIKNNQTMFSELANSVAEKTFEQIDRAVKPPVDVARTVHRALTEARPKTRYLVHFKRYRYWAIKFIPDTVIDGMIKNFYQRLT
jgi:NAD(P)-dependent dehydrogenase (short-subunit alcohol dehydrogenase family)